MIFVFVYTIPLRWFIVFSKVNTDSQTILFPQTLVFLPVGHTIQRNESFQILTVFHIIPMIIEASGTSIRIPT